MPTNETIVEVIKFTAKGVNEVVAQTKVLNREVSETSRNYGTLLGLLNRPGYAKHLAWQDKMNASIEIGTARLRNLSLASRVAEGSYQRQSREIANLNKQYDRMQRLATPKSGRAFLGESRELRQRQQLLERGMRDGSLGLLERRRREYERTRREAELIAKYGETTGRFLARYGGALSAVGRAGAFVGGAALATGGALAHRGFQGTVEAARLESEWSQLAREMAGVFKPVVAFATGATRAVRQNMQRLSPEGQDAVMFGGLGAAGLGIAGYRGFPVWGNTKAAGRWALGSGGGIKAAAGRLGPIGIGAYSVYEGSTGGYYTEMRARGHSKAMAAVTSVGGGFTDLLSQPLAWAGITEKTYGQAFRERMGTGQGVFSTREQMAAHLGVPVDKVETGGNVKKTHREVTLAGGGWEETGSGYERLAGAVEKLQGAGGKDEEELGPVFSKLLSAVEWIAEFLADHAPGSKPSPRSN